MTDRNDPYRKKDSPEESAGINRRDFLKTTATTAIVAGASPMFFTRNAWAKDYPALGNFPVKGKDVVFGFNVPLTGSYADEGADQLRGYKLAVKHLNEGGGMLETLQPSSLTGQGVLGKRVTYVSGDTQTNPDAARIVARRMIERDKVIMYSGCTSSAVAIAQQYLAQQMGVIYLAGLSHSNDTTGKDRRRYGFRHFFNAYMSGKALGPVLAGAYGKDRRAFHLTADYTWGHSQYESMKQFTEESGWSTVNNILTPLGSTDYSQYLTAFLNSDADVLVLNHYGHDMVYSLTQAVQFGVRDMQRDGRDVQIVVPFYSRLNATGAGASNMDGIYGTTNWSWALQDPGSQIFIKTFEKEHGFPPSQSAHTAYVQTLVYANAAERAGTFYPPELIKAMEDFEFTGTSPGTAIYRGSDHQCFKDVLVVQGKGPKLQKDEHDLFDIIQQVKRDDVMYPADYFPGELGPYTPG